MDGLVTYTVFHECGGELTLHLRHGLAMHGCTSIRLLICLPRVPVALHYLAVAVLLYTTHAKGNVRDVLRFSYLRRWGNRFFGACLAGSLQLWSSACKTTDSFQPVGYWYFSPLLFVYNLTRSCN